MKKPGFWYDKYLDTLFVVYPNGKVEFFEHESNPRWTQETRCPEIWVEEGYTDEFVGDL